jgi:hypothetical protein
LSVAFTKEDSAETASETLLPDRPISPHPNLVTEAGLKALQFQLHQAREAYETAQKIDDVNERRRQAAIPLRDARYFAARVRTAQVITNLTSTDTGLWQPGDLQARRWARTEISYRGRGRSRPQGRFNFLRIPSSKASDGQGCRGCSRYIRSRARDHCDLVVRPHRKQQTFGMAALRQNRPFIQGPISAVRQQKTKGHAVLHRMAFARLSP